MLIFGKVCFFGFVFVFVSVWHSRQWITGDCIGPPFPCP